VNEFLNEYRGDSDLLFMQNSRTVDLLDSDMSVDEFKEEWAKYALKERFNITLSGEDAKNAVNILKELNEKGVQNIDNLEKEDNTKEKKFTPIQVTKKSHTYKLEADERFKELYKFIKSEFDSGKSMFEILEKVAKLKVDKRA
ncbi:hypothetical protein, partial [Campylobacter concisus]|uniref:hypothetical protein n=1 Tax=Campylobacter concisus TaxID=199 RepID=UPI001CB71956